MKEDKAELSEREAFINFRAYLRCVVFEGMLSSKVLKEKNWRMSGLSLARYSSALGNGTMSL